MRGRKMSSANFVWPVHLARASTLRKGLPTTFSGRSLLWLSLAISKFHAKAPRRKAKGAKSFATIETLARQFHFFTTHPRRRQLNGFVDFDIAGAATEIA